MATANNQAVKLAYQSHPVEVAMGCRSQGVGDLIQPWKRIYLWIPAPAVAGRPQLGYRDRVHIPADGRVAPAAGRVRPDQDVRGDTGSPLAVVRPTRVATANPEGRRDDTAGLQATADRLDQRNRSLGVRAAGPEETHWRTAGVRGVEEDHRTRGAWTAYLLRPQTKWNWPLETKRSGTAVERWVMA